MPPAVRQGVTPAKDWAQHPRLTVFPEQRAREPLPPAFFCGGPVSE